MKRWGTVAVVATIGLLAAACGSDDQSADEPPATSAPTTTESGSTTVTSAGGGDTTTATDESSFAGQTADEATAQIAELVTSIADVTGNTTRGVSADEVRVGAVTALKTAQGIEPFPGQCEGAEARFERANSEGGVNGRMISWLGCKDDGSDRDRNRQLMQEMVENEEAFALLPVASQGFFSEDYLNEQHVPYFGFGFQPGFCGYDHPFAFGNTLTVCPPEALPGHAVSTPGQSLALAEALGKENLSGVKVVVVYEDTPSSKAGIPIVNRQFVDAGADLVATFSNLPAPPAPPVTDFTPYVNDVVGESPDLVVLITGPENQLGMTGALKGAGFGGDIAGYNFSDARIFEAANLVDILDGTYQINVGIGNPVFGGEAFDAIRADLDAAGSTDVPISGGVLIGYSAADMFLDVLAKVPEPLTAEAFVNTINAGYQYPGLGNAVCASNWPMTHYGGPFCYSVMKLDKSAQGFTPGADLKDYPFAVVEAD